MRHGMRQGDLADAMGYEQTYISALEIGTKGPPTAEFIERAISALRLCPAEQAELRTAAAASERQIKLRNDMPEALFWMVSELRDHLETLHPAQVTLIREIIGMRARLAESPPAELHRIRKRPRSEATM